MCPDQDHLLQNKTFLKAADELGSNVELFLKSLPMRTQYMLASRKHPCTIFKIWTKQHNKTIPDQKGAGFSDSTQGLNKKDHPQENCLRILNSRYRPVSQVRHVCVCKKRAGAEISLQNAQEHPPAQKASLLVDWKWSNKSNNLK